VKRQPLLAAAAALLVCAHGGAGAAPDASARDVVSRLNDSMLAVLRRADELGYEGRYRLLDPALAAAFDLDFMAQYVVGRHWAELSAADRERWRTAFQELTTANYAGRLTNYNGQSFSVLGEEAGAHDTVMVRAKVTEAGADDVEMSYRLRQTPAGWRIIDVFLKGTVSELALRRSEYAAVLKQDGFEALVAAVKRKIADLAAGPPAQ
jgi:phospholipid transport system substrate-binding protein